MTDNEYDEVKKNYLTKIKRLAVSEEGVNPMITVTGFTKRGNRKTSLDIPIPPEALESNMQKQLFVDSVVPTLGKLIQVKTSINAVMLASEAWVRFVSGTHYPPDNWKELPTKEALIIRMETEGRSEIIVFAIKRSKLVDKKKGLINQVELIPLDQLLIPYGLTIGLFSGLYNKFVNDF